MEKDPLEIQSLNLDDLVVDEQYQRPLDGPRVLRYAKAWRDELCQPPFVLAGQHRLAAARLVPGKTSIYCVIHRGLTRAEEAALMVDLERNRRDFSNLDLFWGLYISGDAKAVAVHDIVTRHGLKVGRKVGSNASRVIVGTAALLSIYARGERVLEDVVTIIDRAWDGAPNACVRGILHGLGLFVATNIEHENYDIALVVEKLRACDVDEIAALARDHMRKLNLSAPQAYAYAILSAYNRRKSTRKLPETLFRAA